MTLARAGSVELYSQARLQGIKNMAGGEEAEEVCATLREVWQEMEGWSWYLEAGEQGVNLASCLRSQQG